jgi:hypothetical protein|tara:strand:+ start:345 stop:728 length:384 start_codon:yes stop_codon:yes gene_type:complete
MYSKIILAVGFVLWATLQSHAHEMTPAYPKLKPSFMEGIWRAKLKIFNRRSDVNHYLIEVFTYDWKPIPFASATKIINLKLNKAKLFNVYIRSEDVEKTVYICTTSKLFKATKQVTLISSRICSKIK